jgi:hypothetical protein
MGLEKEETFEFIRNNNSFYNTKYLEAISSLGNDDAIIVVGGGIQNDTVFLTAFTNSLMAINFEPNPKMIDIGLRNSQNNPGASRNMFVDSVLPKNYTDAGMIKNALTLYLNWKTPDRSEYAAICPAIEPTRLLNNQRRFGAIPDDLDYTSEAFLKNGKFKSIRSVKYASDTFELSKMFEEYKLKIFPEPAALSLSVELDEILSSIHAELAISTREALIKNIDTPFSPGRPRAGYNFDKFIGIVVIDVANYSLDILKTGVETLKFFYPHIGVVVYDEVDQDKKILEIEKILGDNYEKIYDAPPPLDPGGRSLVYKSLRRSS